MQNGMQATLDGPNGRAGRIASRMIVLIIWDQELEEDFVIIIDNYDLINFFVNRNESNAYQLCRMRRSSLMTQ